MFLEKCDSGSSDIEELFLCREMHHFKIEERIARVLEVHFILY